MNRKASRIHGLALAGGDGPLRSRDDEGSIGRGTSDGGGHIAGFHGDGVVGADGGGVESDAGVAGETEGGAIGILDGGRSVVWHGDGVAGQECELICGGEGRADFA